MTDSKPDAKSLSIPVKPQFKEKALLRWEQYLKMYQDSISNPERFWAEQAERITWSKKWTQVKSTTFLKPVKIEWYRGAELNACYNCVDRHLANRAQKVALIWEPDNPKEAAKKITYQELYTEVVKFAQVLKSQGVK